MRDLFSTVSELPAPVRQLARDASLPGEEVGDRPGAYQPIYGANPNKCCEVCGRKWGSFGFGFRNQPKLWACPSHEKQVEAIWREIRA